MSSCTIVNTSFPTGAPTLSELDISDEFTAKAEVTKILGFDFQINEKEKDMCHLCGCETPHYKDGPIDKRYNYIEGAGQLCQECYDHCEALRFYTSP